MKTPAVRFFSALSCSAAWVGLIALSITPTRLAYSSVVDTAPSQHQVELPEAAGKASEHPARITEWADFVRPSIVASASLNSIAFDAWDAPRANDDNFPADDSMWQTATPAAAADDSLWSWLFGLATDDDPTPADPMADWLGPAAEPVIAAASTGTEAYALILAGLGALGFAARRRKD